MPGPDYTLTKWPYAFNINVVIPDLPIRKIKERKVNNFSNVTQEVVAEWRLLLYELRIIKILKAFLNKHWFESGSSKPKVVRSAQPTGATGEVSIDKMDKHTKEITWLATH